jgi:hypothetical protein
MIEKDKLASMFLILAFGTVGAAGLTIATGCEEGALEDAGEEIEDAGEEIGDEIDDAVDD